MRSACPESHQPRQEGLLCSLIWQDIHCNALPWTYWVHRPLMAYRTSVQESTGCTPFYLKFGREVRLPADVMFGLPPVSTPQQVNKYALNLRTQLETAYEWIRGHMELQQRRQKALYDKATNGIHSRLMT